MRMRQLFSNLVDNAIRVMPDGGSITLFASVSEGSLSIDVTDDGPGIPPELLPTVFDRFTKSATSRGSGLGLAIARAIVTAHHGTITATSDRAHVGGTTIRVVLPIS